MGKVVCFGEVMLRLSPPGYYRLQQTNSFDVVFGGAEANVSVSLANYGEEAAFVCAIPKNPIGDACLNSLRWFGVDTSMAPRQGERLGIYYCEKGASMRPSKVVYDRKYSAMSAVKPGDS